MKKYNFIIIFNIRKNARMKKTTFLFGLIVLIGLGLTVENLFPNILSFSKVLSPQESNNSDYSKKYADCINEGDFLNHYDSKSGEYSDEQEGVFEEINMSLEKYRHSLDSTIKNLNTIDAHEFLHREYEKSKVLIQKDKSSKIKRYYHTKAMEICYTKDKSLNTDLNNNM